MTIPTETLKAAVAAADKAIQLYGAVTAGTEPRYQEVLYGPASDMPETVARAVLDAITEAGTIEWAIQYGDGDIDQGYLHKSEALTDIARLRKRILLGSDNYEDHEPMTLLMRLKCSHSTEWERVE